MDLLRYARGTLSAERAAEVREHCECCARCGGELGALLLLRTADLARGE
jgi:hypothetical protein